MRRVEAEVCVLGGGPGGSSAARKLALLGHRVVVVERAAFPRAHIGESLPASVLPLLDVLGVRERVERAGFLRPAKSRS
jgi:flavin-dependent dehydrogenase